MKNIVKTTSVLFLMLGMINTVTAAGAKANGIIKDLKVTVTHVEFGFGSQESEPLCQLTSDGNFIISNNHSYFDEAYSLLLSAVISNRAVEIVFDNESRTQCEAKEVRILI